MMVVSPDFNALALNAGLSGLQTRAWPAAAFSPGHDLNSFSHSNRPRLARIAARVVGVTLVIPPATSVSHLPATPAECRLHRRAGVSISDSPSDGLLRCAGDHSV